MKKALLVGINNYPGTGSDLRGCVNDAASADAPVWIVIAGITLLLPESGLTATRGYVARYSSTQTGRAGELADLYGLGRNIGVWLDTSASAGAATRALIQIV